MVSFVRANLFAPTDRRGGATMAATNDKEVFPYNPFPLFPNHLMRACTHTFSSDGHLRKRPPLLPPSAGGCFFRAKDVPYVRTLGRHDGGILSACSMFRTLNVREQAKRLQGKEIFLNLNLWRKTHLSTTATHSTATCKPPHLLPSIRGFLLMTERCSSQAPPPPMLGGPF